MKDEDGAWRKVVALKSHFEWEEAEMTQETVTIQDRWEQLIAGARTNPGKSGLLACVAVAVGRLRAGDVGRE